MSNGNSYKHSNGTKNWQVTLILYLYFLSSDNFNLLFLLLGLISPMIFKMEIVNPMEILLKKV